MRLDDEDQEESVDLEQVLGSSGMDARVQQQLLQLLMRSQDLGDFGDGGSDADTSTGEDVNDAPVVADVELDLTSSRAQPPPPPAALESPESSWNAYCREHGIDPASLPSPTSPAADPGVSFDTILVDDVSPVSVGELQLVSATTEVAEDEGHKSLGVRNLALCGRLKTHGEPADFIGQRAVRLNIEDSEGDNVRFIVINAELEGLPPAEFAAAAVTRYTAGTTVALLNFDMLVMPSSFVCAINLGGEEPGVVHRLGDAELPPLKLSQVDRRCTLLKKSGLNGVMVKHSVEGMKDTADEVDVMLRPLLVSLAVAHLRLGADGVALAYATAASQVVFQRGPPAAACVAAQVLNRLGLKTGACAALYLGHFPSGHALEPVETIGHAGLKVCAGIDESRPNVDADAHLGRAIKAGMTQIAEGLAKTEKEWLEHGLGDVPAVQAAAERAANNHGPEAATQLKLEADRLFAAGSSPQEPLKNRRKVEEAVTKWRAALWLMLDPLGQEGRTGFYAWSVLNGRYTLWDEASGIIEPKALHYMDLAALTVMRDCHVNLTALRSNVYKGRCKVGDWESVLDDALGASLHKLDISV